MCIYIYVCVYMYICLYVYVYMYICIYVYLYMYIHTLLIRMLCMYIYIYIYMFVWWIMHYMGCKQKVGVSSGEAPAEQTGEKHDSQFLDTAEMKTSSRYPKIRYYSYTVWVCAYYSYYLHKFFMCTYVIWIHMFIVYTPHSHAT